MGTGLPTLEARSEPVGPAFDLLAAYRPPDGFLFERRAFGVVAGVPTVQLFALDISGEAGIVELLRTAMRDTGEPSPVAVGALGSDRGGSMMIGRTAVRRTPTGAWRTDVVRPGTTAAMPTVEPVTGVTPHAPFTDLQLTEVPSSSTYAEAVASAVASIHRSDLRKVVLARTIEVDAGRELDPRLLAHRLRAVDPDAFTFAAPSDGGVIVGASPELLVSRFGREVRSNPLAGSAPRSGDSDEDRANAETLEGSAKDREEHAIVAEAVAEVLGPFCQELAWDPEPVLRETPNVWHLSTRFRGVLRDPPPTALDLVAALHPTPAIAGTPTDVALATIEELEPFARGRYAGPVGWVDADGDGEWAIALRCAELRGDHATLYAGAGIVAGSDPQAELDETERKFRAFLDALRWG